MKKQFINLRTKASVVFLVICLIAAFIHVSFTESITLTGIPMECVGRKDTLIQPTRQWQKYDWYYVMYASSDGDTIVVPPGQTIHLKNDGTTYKSMMKVMDMWMLPDARKYNIGLEGWFVGEKTEPEKPERKTSITLKLSEFKKPENMVVCSLPIVVPKRDDKYFDIMRSISNEVDATIEVHLSRENIVPRSAAVVFGYRKGKPKLRPLLTHLSSRLFSSEAKPEVCAAQEANTLSLYASNWIIDAKYPTLNSGELTLASATFHDIAYRCLSSVQWGHTLHQQLHYSNTTSYQGQVMDTEVLKFEHKAQFPTYESFMETYGKRCTYLNAPYGFSLWSGGVVHNASLATLGNLYAAGLRLGTGLQMINDLNDAFAKRGNDRALGRLTLPLWLLEQGTTSADVVRIIKEETKRCYTEARTCIYNITGTQGDESKEFLCAAFEVLRTNRIFAGFT